MGRSFAFEPADAHLPYIRANVERAMHRNIVLIESAVGAANGIAAFWSEDLTGQNGSMIPGFWTVEFTAKSHGVRSRTREASVDVVTMDSFAERTGVAPAFAKIDVEGAEFRWF